MKLLAIAVGILAVVCFGGYAMTMSTGMLLLGVAAAICAATTWRSADISTFLKIFVAVFSTELVLFGAVMLAAATPYWPEALNDYRIPESLPLTVAMFSILVFAVSHLQVVRAITVIADRYFDTPVPTRARIWPFAAFAVNEAFMARAMVVTLVLINQAQVAINVRLSFFSRDWFNAIQAKDAATFWRLLFTVFLFWAAIYIIAAVLEFVMQSMLTIRWRRFLTDRYVTRWLDNANHYRMSLRGDNADNPDQRIAEDVNRFIDGGSIGYGIYSFSILLIATLSSLVSFAIILWMLSQDFTIPGTNIAVPGFLFWVALIYAALGTFITHWIGRPLVGLSFHRQRVEADFRFSLARLREYSEQVALLRGEATERASANGRFGRIYANYLDIVTRRKQLLAFTATYGQVSPFIPYIVAAPFYFAGRIELGTMTQTASAFGRVEGALNFFVTYYASLAEFRAVLDRLTSFDAAIESAHAVGCESKLVNALCDHPSLSLRHLSLSVPDGRTIVEDANAELPAHENVLISGPSGSGKSTLLRALVGVWPYGQGTIEVPANASVLLLPQRPYIPMGSLARAVAYPSDVTTFDPAALADVLDVVGLHALTSRLEEDNRWALRLSGGEQQRLSIARALLAKPDWLLLDEATSALDEASEAKLYALLGQRLPKTTIVSIGHRSTLVAMHARTLLFQPTADGYTLRGTEKAVP